MRNSPLLLKKDGGIFDFTTSLLQHGANTPGHSPYLIKTLRRRDEKLNGTVVLGARGRGVGHQRARRNTHASVYLYLSAVPDG